MEEVTREKERLELSLSEETALQFAHMHPSFRDKQLTEKLRVLEKELQKLSGPEMQRLLHGAGLETATVCLYACGEEAREKMMSSFSRVRREMLMQDVIWREAIAEQKVLEEVTKMGSVLSELQKRGEISVS